MATQKFMLSEFPWDERYRVTSIEEVLTPALVLYPEIIASNIARTLHLLGGDADRWRAAHQDRETGLHTRACWSSVESGISSVPPRSNCWLPAATGAADVLVAYPMMGANARRVREIADQFPDIRISVLAENEEQVRQWRGGRIGIFLDMNPGMNRTGVEQSQAEEIVKLMRGIEDAGLEFRGLHYYDGQYGGMDDHSERTAAAHAGYDRLLEIVNSNPAQRSKRAGDNHGGDTRHFPARSPIRVFTREDSSIASRLELLFIAMLPVSHSFPATMAMCRRCWC